MRAELSPSTRSQLRWLLALVVLALFAFPLKLGLKPDAALYTALARNISEYGWWPLHVSPHLFPRFYEHPPGIPWAMALFTGLAPANIHAEIWLAALFSRLCTLGIFLLGLRILGQRSASEEAFGKRAFLFTFLLLSWGQFLKYAGAAQLEGPTGLVLLGWLALWVTPIRLSRLFPWAVVLGLAAFLTKGLYFAPLMIAIWILAAARTREGGGRVALGITLGFALGVVLIEILDRRSGTSFQSYYWRRLLEWGSGESRAGLSTGYLARIAGFFRNEIHYAALWIVPFWLVALRALARPKRELLWRDVLSRTALLFYAAVAGALMLTDVKLPHWTVPLTPVAALWLTVALQPETWTFWPKPRRVERGLRFFVAAVLVTLLVLPSGLGETSGRGENWIARRDRLLSSPALLRIARLPSPHASADQNYPNYVYSALFLGPDYPLRFERLEDIVASKCQVPSRLWVHAEQLAGAGRREVEARGWQVVSDDAPSPSSTLYECTN